MNKAVPWNVNGVGFDAREAAREAARRQGKSLGEWLQSVIAERADDIGIEPDHMGSRQRVEAVTSKLERLSARSQAHDRRTRTSSADDLPERRRQRERTSPRYEEDSDDLYERELGRSARHRPRATEISDPILEDAIEAMDRRAKRAERRADEALRSVADLLEQNETRREGERETVTAFAKKLSDIETRLTKGFAASDDNPIKGALSRLEARLDRIGRRGVAEAAVVQQTAGTDKPAFAAPLQRLEEKLNTILDAVHGQAPDLGGAASPIAMTAAREVRGGDRRLGAAIADISRRQQTLDGTDPRPAPPHEPIRPRIADLGRDRFAGRNEPPAIFAAMQREIATLASKIESLPQDLAEKQRPAPVTVDLDGVRSEIAAMSDRLRDFAPHGRVSALEDAVRGLTERLDRPPVSHGAAVRAEDSAFGTSAIDLVHEQMREIRDLVSATASAPLAVERIEQQIAALRDRIDRPAAIRDDLDRRYADEMAHHVPTPEPASVPDHTDVSVLEGLVRELSQKMEAAQAPEANAQAFDALQDQIATLATRFESSDGGLAKLASLERSMRDLFTHLEQTRASVETSAARAAREALRIAMEEGRSQTEQGAATSLATMQLVHEEADARTKSTLSAFHETLEKVVDRLALMETDIAEARGRGARVTPVEPPARARPGSAEDRKAKPQATSLASADSFLEQVLGQKASEPASKKSDRLGGAGKPLDIDADAERAGFIAAARRAARIAQSDPSVGDLRQSAADRAANPVRAGLIEQTRDYVARHKRPVLLSMAALFVIIGTTAIMQRIGSGGDDSQLAEAPRPAISRTVAELPQPRPARQSAALTPSTLPKGASTLGAPIPGSDPIQTGSIASLPAFAAQSAAQAAPRPSVPAGLKTAANAGDGAAEYVLGSQYAEGRLIPRDFRQAASWYQKAADQGIVPAQYRLASLYEKGLGVAQDKAKAKALYIRAAEAGNPRAMHNLAVLLADGDGKPDYEGAATWFRKAAQYGVHDSQFNLAILLARGLGTQQSFVQSYQWFAIAAAQDDSDAAKKRDEVATKLNANDLAVAKALATSFHPRIADIAATEVQPPPGGWDGASAPSPVNSARSKISSL